MGSASGTRGRSFTPRFKYVGLALLGVFALIVVGLAFERTSSVSTEREARVVDLYTPATTAPAQPFPADLPTNANVVIVGDSWSAGYGAANPVDENWANVAATSLGWNLTKFALGGAGYTQDGTYQAFVSNFAYTLSMASERSGDAAAIDLVVIQGGINDTVYREDPETLTAAFQKTILTAQTLFPNAHVVVLGPMPPTDDYELAVEQVSRTLSEAAAAAQIPYIDADKLGWFGAFSREGRVVVELVHPNEVGYAHIAAAFVEYVQTASKN